MSVQGGWYFFFLRLSVASGETHMLKEEIIDFFENVMPFNQLTRESLGEMVDEISMEYYQKDQQILQQDGPPSEFLGVIKKGGVKVYQISDNNEEDRGEYEEAERQARTALSICDGSPVPHIIR